MPKLVFKNLEVTLPPAALKLYKNFEDTSVLTLASGVEVIAGTPAVLSGRLHQLANGAIYTSPDSKEFEVIHNEKLEALESYIEELSGKPTLVMYEFNHDLARIRTALGDLPNLGSGISIKNMESLVDKFNAGTIPVLLGHPASMGHGLNLQQSCHHIIWFSVPWDLDFYDQALGRIYRQGQESETVFVYHIVAKGTKDEDILPVIDVKDREQQKLLRALN